MGVLTGEGGRGGEISKSGPPYGPVRVNLSKIGLFSESPFLANFRNSLVNQKILSKVEAKIFFATYRGSIVL